MYRASHADVRVSRKAVWGGEVGGPVLRLIAVLALAALSGSCGDVSRQGTGSSFLIIQQLEASSGAEPGTFGANLLSDVITIVDDVPTVFNDVGRVRFSLAMKDPGGADQPSGPTPINFITINRYHVRYFRTDGRNTPGVDVPSAFDGAVTGTVGAADLQMGFEVVRHVAKQQAPLRALASNGIIISTIAEITFYGRDQAGRDVAVTGQMMIDFGNFGDPQ
jgi:hypothetical protein